MATKTFLFLSIFLSCTFLYSQTREQISERRNFIRDLSRQISNSQDNEAIEFVNNKLSKALIDDFSITDEQFKRITTHCDLMVEKRHTAYPHVYNYIISMYALYIDLKKPENQVNVWHNTFVEQLNNRNPRRVQEFLETSGNLFYKGILYQDPNFQWVTHNKDLEFYIDKTPFVKFENTTIVCRTTNRGRNQREVPYSDSIKIENTSGVMNFNRSTWEGNGGKYTWEKVGLSTDETFAILKSYNLSLRSTNFTSDSVTLTTPHVNESIEGRLIDRAIRGSSGSGDNNSDFPQFTSYKADFKIKNILEDIDYEGGFSLNGNEFIGVGNQDNQAKLTYFHNGKEVVHSFSDQVRIKGTTLNTPMARFYLFLGENDTIMHPGLDILYNNETKIVSFIRGSSPITQAPFINTYHQLNLYVEELYFDKRNNKLILGFNKSTSEAQRVARFESFQYYDEQLFQRIQGMSSVNPLTALFNYAWKYDRFEMTEGMASTALDRTIEQAKPTLLELSTLGFITYDTQRGIVRVTDKTTNFVRAKSGKIDYDNLSFTSNLAPLREDPNRNDPEMQEKINERNRERARITEYGTIDLTSLDMQINAIDYITVSESSRTTIFPEENKATFKENRNIVFSGWVNSGKWEINILSGDYNYDENKFNIYNSEAAYFHVAPLKKEDGDRYIPLQSTISGIKGELLVNDVSNRSGLKKGFDHFPTLVSKEKARVYYDYRSLHLGAYDKERFYYELDPFTIDSLATFTDENITFSGELTSAGIFPKIRQDVKIMPDYSLGFSKEAPADGYPFYGTAAKYNNKILLSNNGLQGGGTIDFLNSSSTSKNLFTFLPDSTIGVASFINKPQEGAIQFPDADGPDVLITFLPREKTLKVQSYQESIALYNGEGEFKGTAILREKGMRGSGIIELNTASMMADNFDFKRWEASSDTASFQLKNNLKEEGDLIESPLSFKTDNVNGFLNFEDRKGVFTSNAGESIVEFPVNQYVCLIDQFTWMMDYDELALEKKEVDDIEISGDLDLVGPNFFSVHPRQDSLQFKTPKAKFDLKDNTIYAYDTEFIEVADARIYPDSAKVVIRRKAKMDPFENAEIIANHITKYHHIVNADVQVTARRAYTASGEYQYGQKESETRQSIFLNEISVDTSFQTIAKGTIALEQDFTLSEQFGYNGDVFLKAADPFLYFKGATRLNHECDKFARNWMAFEASIDPDNILIPIKENMQDIEGNKLNAGIQWRFTNHIDSVSLYPTFLSEVENENDPEVISASGFLHYDEAAKEFQISNKEKLVNRSEPGNYISLHTQSCSMNGDGVINLGMDFGALETTAVGVINYNQATDQTDMNVTLAIRAPIYEKAFENIGTRIAEYEALQDGDFSSTTLEQALVEWVDLSTADKIRADYTLKREFKTVPRPMRDAIVISGLRLTSHTKAGDPQRGLKSSVSQAVIVNLFKTPVMKYVPLKMFAEFRPLIGNRLGLHIDIPGDYMYFIDYDFRRDGVMNILSSDPGFNEEIEGLNPNSKKERRFSFDVTKSSTYINQFMRIFNQ